MATEREAETAVRTPAAQKAVNRRLRQDGGLRLRQNGTDKRLLQGQPKESK